MLFTYFKTNQNHESRNKWFKNNSALSGCCQRIDGHQMARCTYYPIAFKAPMLDTDVQIEGTNSPFLFIAL